MAENYGTIDYSGWQESRDQTFEEFQAEEDAKRKARDERTSDIYDKGIRDLQAEQLERNREDRLKAYSGIPTDSTVVMTAKDMYNSFVNWSSKVFTGEGADDSSLFDINFRGSKISSLNKDLGAYQDKTLNELVDDYHNAKDDPKARHVVYTIKEFDGYNPDGSSKYLYKTGVDTVSAYNRYKEQLDPALYKIVDEKRFAGAENWENAYNMLAHTYRAVDKGRDKASGVNFGSGYTELVTKDILGLDGKGIDYRQKKEESKQKLKDYRADGYDKNGNKLSDSVVDAVESGAYTAVGGIGKGVTALFTDLPMWLYDKGNELATGEKTDRTKDEYGFDIKKDRGFIGNHTYDFFDNLEKNSAQIAGYDRRLAEQVKVEAANDWNNGRQIQAIFGFSNFGGHLNELGESAFEMAVLIGTPELLVGKAGIASGRATLALQAAKDAKAVLASTTTASAKNVALQTAKLDKTIEKQEKILATLEMSTSARKSIKEVKELAKLKKLKAKGKTSSTQEARLAELEASTDKGAEALKKSGYGSNKEIILDAKSIAQTTDMTMIQKAMYATAGNLGFDAIWLKNANNAFDERKASGDKDISISEAFAISSAQFISTALDKVVDGVVVGGTANSALMKNMLTKAAKYIPEPVKKSLLAKAVKNAGGFGVSTASEGIQEYLQTWTDILTSKAGIDEDQGTWDSIKEEFNKEENQKTVLEASLAGAFGGGAMHTGFGGIRASYDVAARKVGLRPSKNQQEVINRKAENEINARKKIKKESDLLSNESSIYEKKLAILAHLDETDDHFIETDKSEGELIEVLKNSISKQVAEDFEINNPKSQTDLNRNTRIDEEKTRVANQQTANMMTDFAMELFDKAQTYEKGSEEYKQNIDSFFKLIDDENIGNLVRDNIVRYTANGVKSSFTKVWNSAVSSLSKDSKESGSDVSLDEEKVGSKKNPVYNKLSTQILRAKNLRKRLVDENIADENNEQIKVLDEQIKLLHKYHTDENFNFYNKKIGDIGTEIGTLGHMMPDGTLSPVSIDDYSRDYLSSLNGATGNSEISYDSMNEFISQRRNKNAPRKDNKRHTNAFMTKIVEENSKIEKVLFDTHNATTDKSTRAKVYKQIEEIRAINNDAMNMMYSIASVVDNENFEAVTLTGDKQTQKYNELKRDIQKNDDLLSDKKNGITEDTHFAVLKQKIKEMSQYKLEYKYKKELFKSALDSLSKNDKKSKPESEKKDVEKLDDNQFRKLINNDLANANTTDDVELIFQTAKESGSLTDTQLNQLLNQAKYTIDSINSNQDAVTYEELGSLEEQIGKAENQNEFLSLKTVIDGKRLTYFQRKQLGEVLLKNEERLRNNGDDSYDLSKDSTFANTVNNTNLKEQELVDIEKESKDIDELSSLSKSIEEDSETYANLNDGQKKAVEMLKTKLVSEIEKSRKEIEKNKEKIKKIKEKNKVDDSNAVVNSQDKGSALIRSLTNKIVKIKKRLINAISKIRDRIVKITGDIESKTKMVQAIDRYIAGVETESDSKFVGKSLRKEVVKRSDTLASKENVSKVAKEANKGLNEVTRTKLVQEEDSNGEKTVKLGDNQVNRDVTSRNLKTLADLKRKSTASTTYKHRGMTESLAKLKNKMKQEGNTLPKKAKKALKDKITKLEKDIQALKYNEKVTKDEAKELDDLAKTINVEDLNDDGTINKDRIIGTDTISRAKELTGMLTIDGSFKSNGAMILENVNDSLKKFFNESKQKKNPIGSIPSIVSLFHLKDVQDELLRSIGEKEYNKVYDGLMELNKAVRNIDFKEPDVYLDEDGTLTYISDEGGLFTRNSNEDLIDMVEIFSTYREGTKGESGKLIIPEPIKEAIKVGILKIIGSRDNIMGNISDKNPRDLAKDTGIPEGKALDRYKNEIARGNIPEALYRKEIESLISDLIGIKVNKDVDYMVKDALIKSITAHAIEQLKVQGVLSKDINTIEFTPTVKLRMVQIDMKKVGKKLGKSDLIKDGSTKLSFISGTHNANAPKRSASEFKESTKYKNSDIKLSDEQIAEIKNEEKVEWRFSQNTEMFAKLYNNENEEDTIKVLKAMGYIDIENDVNSDGVKYSDLHYLAVNEIASHNMKIEKEAESLFRYYDEFGKDGFHIKYEINVSGRTAMASDLTVMDSKIHRTYLHSKAYKGKLSLKEKQRDIRDIDEFNLTGFERYWVAIGQGFDLDPDKLGKHGFFKAIRNIATFNNKDGVTVNKTDHEELYNFIEAEEFDIDLLIKALDSFNFATGARMHLSQAMVSLRNLNQSHKTGKKTHQTTMWAESDAITSGSMLQQLRIGTMKAFALLEKGGIWTEESIKKWTEYTKKLLAHKHGVPESEITFHAGSLFEAGKYHADLLRNNDSSLMNDDGAMATDNYVFDDFFKDTYITTGSRAFEIMNEKLKAKETGEMSAMESLMTDTLLNNVKEKGLFKVFRSMSKYPTMHDGFGSSIRSIKDLISSDNFKSKWYEQAVEDPFGYNIFSVSIAESMLQDLRFRRNNAYKTKEDKESIETEIKDIENRLSKKNGEELKQIVISYLSNIDNLETMHDNGMNYRPTQEEFDSLLEENNGDITKLAKYAKINASVDTALQSNSDETIGNSFGEAFSEIFEERNTVNDAIKAMDVIVSTSFQIKVQEKFTELLSTKLENNQKITEKEFDKILSDLFDDGYGHSIDYKNGAKQPLVKDDDGANATKRAYASITRNSNGTSITINIKNFKDNSTASVVVPIHFLDDRIMKRAVNKTDNQSIYDAIIFGVNNSGKLTVNNYNTGAIEESLYDNHTKRYFEKLINMIDTVDVKDIANDFSPIESITPSQIHEGRTTGYGFVHTTREKGKDGKFTYTDSMVVSKDDKNQQDVKTQVIDNGKKIVIEYRNGKYLNKTVTMTRAQNGKYTVNIKYKTAKEIKDNSGKVTTTTRNKYVEIKDVEIPVEVATFDNPDIYKNVHEVVLELETEASNVKKTKTKKGKEKEKFEIKAESVKLKSNKPKKGEKYKSNIKLTLDTVIDYSTLKTIRMKSITSVERTMTILGLKPDEFGSIHNVIESGVDIVNDGVNNVRKTGAIYSNHSHVLGMKPTKVKVDKNKIEPIDKKEFAKIKKYFDEVTRLLNAKKLEYLKERHSESKNRRINEFTNLLIDSYEKNGKFTPFTYYATDFNKSKSKMTDAELNFFSEMHRLGLSEKIAWDDYERLAEVKDNENHFPFFELFDYSGDTELTLIDSSDVTFSIALASMDSTVGLFSEKTTMVDGELLTVDPKGGRFGKNGSFVNFTGDQAKVYSALKNIRNKTLREKFIALNRLENHKTENSESIGNWLTKRIDDNGGLGYIKSITNKEVAKELENFYRFAKGDDIVEYDMPKVEYTNDEIISLADSNKNSKNKVYSVKRKDNKNLYIGRIKGYNNLILAKKFDKNPSNMSKTNNFYNPFVAYKNKQNNSKYGVEKWIQNKTEEELNVLYFRWLVHGVIPSGYPRNTESLSALKSRRGFILRNISKVPLEKANFASPIYGKKPNEENLSFASYLMAAARVIKNNNSERSKNKQEGEEKNYSGKFVPIKDDNFTIDIDINEPEKQNKYNKKNGKKKNSYVKTKTIERTIYDAYSDKVEVGNDGGKQEVIYLVVKTEPKTKDGEVEEQSSITHTLYKNKQNNATVYKNKKGVSITSEDAVKALERFSKRDRQLYEKEEKIYTGNNKQANKSDYSAIINKYKKRIEEGCK